MTVEPTRREVAHAPVWDYVGAFLVAEAVAASVFWIVLLTWWLAVAALHGMPLADWLKMLATSLMAALGVGVPMTVFVALFGAIPALLVGGIVLALKIRSRIGFIAAGALTGVIAIFALGMPPRLDQIWNALGDAASGLLLAAAMGGGLGGYAARRYLVWVKLLVP